MLKAGTIQVGALDNLRPALCIEALEAIHLWKIMGGVDWVALPMLIDLHEVGDPELCIQCLATIRDTVNGPKT